MQISSWISFKNVDSLTSDDLITQTIRKEVICATTTKGLKNPIFTTLDHIKCFEQFLETFATTDRTDFVDDLSELERPLQATWQLVNGALQRAVRSELTKLPAHVEGTEDNFSAFIPMGPLTVFDSETIYIPGYHISVRQEGPNACLWAHTLRARTEDIAYEDTK